MEWITSYWYLIVLGLVAAVFLFGYRTKQNTDTNIHNGHQQGSHTEEKAHKSGHGCCG